MPDDVVLLGIAHVGARGQAEPGLKEALVDARAMIGDAGVERAMPESW